MRRCGSVHALFDVIYLVLGATLLADDDLIGGFARFLMPFDPLLKRLDFAARLFERQAVTYLTCSRSSSEKLEIKRKVD